MTRIDYAFLAHRRPFSWRRASLTVAGVFWSAYTVAVLLVLLTLYSWCAVRPFSAGCLS